MAVCTAVLMCHAPIVLPEVGGVRSKRCAQTTAAMIELGQLIAARAPDVLVVLSPHAPRLPTAWAVPIGAQISGHFGRFGAAQVTHSLPNAAHGRALPDPMVKVQPFVLDHGTLVPLHFACAAGWRGPTLVVSLPTGAVDHSAIGAAIQQASEGQRWVVLASGDMSHRLTQGAPAGFDPRAKEFDAAVVRCIEAGDPRALLRIDPELRKLAAEDVVDTTVAGAAAAGWATTGHRALSYEGPFGVGYLQAVLYDQP